MPYIYWLILGIVLIIGEILTMDFSLTCFGIAALVAALLSWLGLNIYWQLTAAAITIFVLLFTLRPFMLKYLNKNGKDFKSNIEALIGKKAEVFNVQNEDKTKALVKIDADQWPVISNKPLVVGDKVKVESIDGATLIVKKEEK
ncbi:MAG: NfeD family protein [Elusimicrobiota bacterium]|jgi:membrane protein implicated in regulation of membrane protease activity|nr:NfeD family protein [Elusimicrobiota bacterium]